MYYVTMTDKFMSGWGPARNKTNKLIIECETMDQAKLIERNAKLRNEMKRVKVVKTKPGFSDHFLPSWKTFDDMGGPWIAE